MKRWSMLFVIPVFCLVLFFGFVTMGPIRFDARYFFQLLSAPDSLRSMVFIEETETESSLVHIKFGGLEKKTFKEFRILQIDQSGDTVVALVESRATDAIDVAQIKGKRLIPLTTDGVEKSSITLAPDGTHVAYALRIADKKDSSQQDEVYRVADYETRVITLSGETTQTFKGNYPFFLSNTLLFGLSEQGLITHDIVTGDETYLQDDLAAFVQMRPSYGRNKTMIVENSFSHEQMVFEFITEEPPFAYQLVTVLNSEPLPKFAFSEDQTVYYGVTENGMFKLQAFNKFDIPPETLLALPTSFLNPFTATFQYE